MESPFARRAAIATAIVAVPGFAFGQAPSGSNQTSAPAVPTTTLNAPVAAASARRASTLIGANIINNENNSVGEIHDLMVDTAGGATIAVLSVGGFLGIGERYVAVPLTDLRWNADRERWALPGATVDSLKARPAFRYPDRG